MGMKDQAEREICPLTAREPWTYIVDAFQRLSFQRLSMNKQL
jgi:hypothetical protein